MSEPTVNAWLAEVERLRVMPASVTPVTFELPAELAFSVATEIATLRAHDVTQATMVRTWMERAGCEAMECDGCKDPVMYLDGNGHDYTDEGIPHECVFK